MVELPKLAMDAERWRRVEEVYYEVVSSHPERRLAMLAAYCAGDLELRQEVESLLSAHDDVGKFLSPDQLLSHIHDLGPFVNCPIAGSRLGQYEVLDAIGAGAMGEVYRARDNRLGREVALKILPAHFTHDGARIARFQLEAKAASALNHPNIVTIYEIGQADKIWYIAAELIEGETLRQWLGRGPLAFCDTLNIVLQCAGALAVTHRAGVVHRDIKPENIMLRPDAVVKIVDFGLARMVEARPEFSFQSTETGSVTGTPRYMSPEQARGQKSDSRSDVFSLGAVLFEMAAGRPAFGGSTAAEIFAALLASEPDTTAAGPFSDVVAKALAKDPAQRFQSMELFADALRALDLTAKPVPRLSRATSRSSTFWPGGFAVTAALIAAVGLAGYGAFSRLSPRERSLKVMPIATVSGSKGYPAISPDGARVVFSWKPPGSAALHIYVKPLGEGAPIPLTTSGHDDVTPVWSPDGAQIAFCRESEGDGDVWQDVYVVPSNRGPERKIARTWRGISWSPDGKTLALTRVPDNGPGMLPKSGGVVLHSLETGGERELTAANRDSFPVFSPNGKWLVFKRLTSGPGQLFLIRPEGGPLKQLTFAPLQPSRYATWTADSRELIFGSLRSGVDGSLWRVSVDGGPPRSVSPTLRDASDPNVSAQGHLAYREEWMDSNLYLLTAKNGRSGGAAKFGEPTAIVNSSREDHSPSFSPDGERIAFVSESSGNLEIWVARRDGSQLQQLTFLRAQNTGTPRWSPDGRQIAFDSWSKGASAIFIIDASGGAPRSLTSGPLGSWMPSWSPDGKWIYFSRGVTSASQLWRMPANGGEPTQITHSGAFESHPAPDGRVVFYTKSNTNDRPIWSVPAEGGVEEPVPELARFNRIIRSWGVTAKGIFFLSYEDSPQQLVRFFNFQTRAVTTLFQLRKQRQWGIGAVALTDDGRYAVVTELDHAVNDLMMIQNFR